MVYIHYSGVGANETEFHSIDEFLNIMKYAPLHYYQMKHYLNEVDMEYKDYSLPDDYSKFTLEEWLEYSGAKYYETEW
jgi:hypothetical protein